jgi:hypothetical protein
MMPQISFQRSYAAALPCCYSDNEAAINIETGEIGVLLAHAKRLTQDAEAAA